MTSSGSFNPDDFVLIPKLQFESLLEGTKRLNNLVKPLIDERDLLRETCDKLSTAGDQLVSDAQELMSKFKVLKEDRDRLRAENERLGAALARSMPRKKPGEGKN